MEKNLKRMNEKEIYSDRITKGNRTYFFDIKKNDYGDLYMKISERKKTENGFDHYRLMVFEEDMNDFVQAFNKLQDKFKELKEPSS